MERFKLDVKDSIAYIIMNNSENKQDLEFAKEFLKVLDEIESDKSIKAAILTSSDEKNWSQGVNVEWIQSKFFGKDYPIVKNFLYSMNEVFKKIIFSPFPVIAEITGHAFGNGALLACCCDFRFMRNDRGFFCFPEVDVKIPFLPSMIAFAKKAIPYQKFQEMVFTGKRYTAKELYQMNILHGYADNLSELKEMTFDFAKTFNKARGIYQELKYRMYVDILDAFEKDKEVIEPLKIFIP